MNHREAWRFSLDNLSMKSCRPSISFGGFSGQFFFRRQAKRFLKIAHIGKSKSRTVKLRIRKNDHAAEMMLLESPQSPPNYRDNPFFCV